MSPEPVVDALLICTSCLRTLVVTGEKVALATAADTVPLSQEQLAKLRKARAAARKALV